MANNTARTGQVREWAAGREAESPADKGRQSFAQQVHDHAERPRLIAARRVRARTGTGRKKHMSMLRIIAAVTLAAATFVLAAPPAFAAVETRVVVGGPYTFNRGWRG